MMVGMQARSSQGGPGLVPAINCDSIGVQMLLPISNYPSESQIDGRDSADTLLVYREMASDVDHED